MTKFTGHVKFLNDTICYLFLPVVDPVVEITSSSEIYYLGDHVNLTCTARTIPQVDSNVIGTFIWQSLDGVLYDSDQYWIDQVGPKISQLSILSLQITDTDFFCSATLRLETNPSNAPSSLVSSFTISNISCKFQLSKDPGIHDWNCFGVYSYNGI